MKLYKNVPIEDLNKIMENGILPISETNNNNWEDGLRGCNPTFLVYLFSPLTEQTTFIEYGIALLEVEVPESTVIETVIRKSDNHKKLYKEYITNFVPVENIKNIFLPKIFKKRLNNFIDKSFRNKVYWCDVELKNDNMFCIEKNLVNEFIDNVELLCTNDNYFKAVRKDRTFLTFNINYKIDFKFDKNDFSRECKIFNDSYGFNIVSFDENGKNFFIKSDFHFKNEFYFIDNNCKLDKNDCKILETFKSNVTIYGANSHKELLFLKCYKKIELLFYKYYYIFKIYK